MPPTTTIDQGAGIMVILALLRILPISNIVMPNAMARITSGIRCQNLIIVESEDGIRLVKSPIINSPFHYLLLVMFRIYYANCSIISVL